MIELRPYQATAVENTLTAWESGHRGVLIVMATGLGKSVVAAEIINRFWEPTLILAHRHELVRQLQHHTQHTPIVIVRTVQSVARNIASGIGAFKPDAFGLIVVDEAHHAVSDTYLKVLKYFGLNKPDSSTKFLGITATPKRTDRRALKKVFQHVSFEYYTKDAIADGWLAPINHAKKCRNLPAYLTLVGDRKTIVFTPTIKAAKLATERLLDKDVTAMWVAGSMTPKTREPILKAFANGEIQFLVNADLLTEGYDLPAIECVTLLRDVESKVLFTQMLGRGLRKYVGKNDCLLVNLSPAALCVKCATKAEKAPLSGVLVKDPPQINIPQSTQPQPPAIPTPLIPPPLIPAAPRNLRVTVREARIMRVKRWILNFLGG